MFSAHVAQTGPKFSSRNSELRFPNIWWGHVEISARLTGLKFQPRLKMSMQSASSFSKCSAFKPSTVRLNSRVKMLLYFLLIYFSISLTGEWCFPRNLIGFYFSEYPVLFISKQNKMAFSYVYVTEELFLTNEVTVPDNAKNPQRNLTIKYSNTCQFFYFLATTIHRYWGE